MLLVLVMASAANTSIAHSLPDSVLSFSPVKGQLSLIISVPVTELVIAAPELEPLTLESDTQELPQAITRLISNYFADHIDLIQASDTLTIELAQATINNAHNEHVGDYNVLDAYFFVMHQQDTKLSLPLTLRYDAVMHEIRNHRAAVFWSEPDQQAKAIARFGLKLVDGQQRPVELVLQQ